MKKKRYRKRQRCIEDWCVLVLLVCTIMYLKSIQIKIILIIGIALLLIPLVAIKVNKAIRRIRYLNSTIHIIDHMSGHEFEKYLAVLFESKGYRVRNVGENGHDFGGDLLISSNNCKILVQAKRYAPGKHCGVKAIQEALSAKEYYRCNKAMVVTTSKYSQQAILMAKRCGVELKDRNWMSEQAKPAKKQKE